MPYDLIVYLNRNDVPSPKTWETAITQAGFPVKLDLDFDIDSHTGSLPCRVRGEISGFEYSSKESEDDELKELELSPEMSFQIRLSSVGSKPLELLAAAAAASVLSRVATGIVYDPQKDKCLSGEESIEWAWSLFNAKSDNVTASPAKKPWWRIWR
jgi:hypothetical protein